MPLRRLKYIHESNVKHHGIRSRMQALISKGNGMGDYIQDSSIREMIDDYNDPSEVRKQANILPPNFSHIKSHPTDEELEDISIKVMMPGHVESSSKTDIAYTEGEESRWQKYKHHQFVKRWGLFEERDGQDEEWFVPDPPILDDQDPQYLCEMCRHIDWTTLFSQRGLPGNQMPGPTMIEVYGFKRVLTAKSCALCRLIQRKIHAGGLLCSDDPSICRSANLYFTVLDEGPEYGLRLDVRFHDDGDQTKIPRFIIQKVEETSGLPLTGLRVGDLADLSQLKAWLHTCEHTHSISEYHKLSYSMAQLRVIDVEKGCIVDAEHPIPYTCLSYVWGGAQQTLYTTETKELFGTPGALFDPSLQLPQTIRDAVEVTRSIDVPYLWVDALCILQDSPEDKAVHIAEMGAIYNNATLCIIASTNIDPNGGLPGVSRPRSSTQIIETVQNMQLAATFHDPRKRLGDIDASVWNSRGWTYQEQQLPSRSVYFTDSEMCFVCPYSACFEDTRPVPAADYQPPALNDKTIMSTNIAELYIRVVCDPTQIRFVNKAFKTNNGRTVFVFENSSDPKEASKVVAPTYVFEPIANTNPTGTVDIHGDNTWDAYRNAVNSFTQRSLTLDADAVNAFRGMENLLLQGVNTKFWFGLPGFAFDQALLWQPCEPLQRRKQNNEKLFPSWSWAAWKGHSHYRGRGWYNGLYRGPVSAIKWSKRLTLEEFIDFHRQRGYKPEALKDLEQKVKTAPFLLTYYDVAELYHLDAVEKQKWEVHRDVSRNQHYYTHDAYAKVKFNYPIPLPDEPVLDRPDRDGVLYFTARTVEVRFCDMQETPVQQEPCQEKFIQIGLNDERRSSGGRPSWKRILYHQGYRAGFLTLNIPFEDLNTSFPGAYILAAMSRDERPRIMPPGEGWDLYWDLDPVAIQDILWHKEEWKDGGMKIPPPKDVAPSTEPQIETGDALWDEGRFDPRGEVYPLYNVLLLRLATPHHSERIGVGKIHFHAFHHAKPVIRDIKLI